MKYLSRRLAPLVALVLLLSALASARAQARDLLNAAETQLALRRLNVVGSALYVGAHPDDENTALLAYLANERGVRAAYLSVTRGDGGQNLIGTEQGAALGLVRTQELLAARRIDSAEQFFTRAIDFGFSKSPEETLRVWGREASLADVVWVIRRFRPDVVITRFPTTGEGGHGHHTASAILAREAFDAAGDPARFPEQLNMMTRPWKPKRLVWNAFIRQGERPANADKLLSVDVGKYNPLLGKSYTEIAARSRSMHRSQGMGAAERRGTALNYFAHVAGEKATKDIFDGVDLTWRRVAGGEAVGRPLEEAKEKYDPANPQAILPLLVGAHRELNRLRLSQFTEIRLLSAKMMRLEDVIRACAGLWIEAVAAEPFAVPGGELRVTTTLVNRSSFPLRLKQLSLIDIPDTTRRFDLLPELRDNDPLTVVINATVPEVAELSQPYWLVEEPKKGLFTVADGLRMIGEPEGDLPTAVVTLSAGEQLDELTFPVPIQFRWTDRVQGEMYRPVLVVPEVAVRVEEKVLVFPDRRPKQVRVRLKSNTAAATGGTLRLRLPAGWTAAPAELPVTFKSKGEEFAAEFVVTPPAAAATAMLAAEFESGGRKFTRGLVEIDYPHIPRQTLLPAAETRLVRVDLARRGARVGYVMGAGDEVPEALRQVGYDVVLLSDEDLEGADLSKFDAVVTGVRAYNTRAALRRQQRRLLEYVERGGTLVVQYNTAERALDGFALGPYPLKLSQERVSVEDAPVALAAPRDEILDAPNKITPADFDGWVQERGLNFPSEWDARYRTPFETHDPGESLKPGGTLVARHGRGVYVYTSYSWFRQLPAGVPGAYRVFVNLISAGKQHSKAEARP